MRTALRQHADMVFGRAHRWLKQVFKAGISRNSDMEETFKQEEWTTFFQAEVFFVE